MDLYQVKNINRILLKKLQYIAYVLCILNYTGNYFVKYLVFVNTLNNNDNILAPFK